MERSAGILLSVSSLASEYGIGCFSQSAYEFIDFLKEAGQRYWQILPLGPTGYGDSPYQAFSTFAGNPYFIDLQELVKEGLLTVAECETPDWGVEGTVDYEKLYTNRFPLLKLAYERSEIEDSVDFQSFVKQEEWLADYALFMAVKDSYGGVAWTQWEEDIRQRSPEAIKRYECRLSKEIGFYKFVQFLFFKQWNRLKAYAHDKGIEIIGDIPIYVALDSADVWANPKLFRLDVDKLPVAVAGCPPDGFSEDGQLWGNPLYDWEYHRKEKYVWWIARLGHCFRLYDVVRIDHFRGFDEYFAIPYGEKTARNGHWEKGPGRELFDAVERALGRKEILAEDLGFVTDSVRELVRDTGFANMKVLEFAFDARDTGSSSDYLPHNYGQNCVAYTGTHDNQTMVSWFQAITQAERQRVRNYLCDWFTPDDKLQDSMIGLLMRSAAKLCVIPMQDYLGYDDGARMNKPGTVGGNWRWRLRKTDMSKEQEKHIRQMTAQFGRMRDIEK